MCVRVNAVLESACPWALRGPVEGSKHYLGCIVPFKKIEYGVYGVLLFLLLFTQSYILST